MKNNYTYMNKLIYCYRKKRGLSKGIKKEIASQDLRFHKNLWKIYENQATRT